MYARLRDMDYDGVAAEVAFHGSANDEPIPFTSLGDPRSPLFFKNQPPEDAELAAGSGATSTTCGWLTSARSTGTPCWLGSHPDLGYHCGC